MRKCKYCVEEVKWNFADQGGWHAAELDGSWHACSGTTYLSQEQVDSIRGAVTVSDKWVADKFIKRISEYIYLHPRAKINIEAFIKSDFVQQRKIINLDYHDFQKLMRNGKKV